MDFKKGLILGYHPANSEEAARIADNLALADYQIQQLKCRKSLEAGAFSRSIQNGSLPTILLISDNFLRSEQCLTGLLDAVRQIRQHQGFIPVVAAGRSLHPEGNTEREFPTDVTSVGGVIAYINFWQDRYLELRRGGQEKPTMDPDATDQELKRVRGLSTEIGELLRLVKEEEPLDLRELEGNKYEAFFRRVKDQDGFEKLLIHLAEEAEEELRQSASSGPLPPEMAPESEEQEVPSGDGPGSPPTEIWPEDWEEEEEEEKEEEDDQEQEGETEVDDEGVEEEELDEEDWNAIDLDNENADNTDFTDSEDSLEDIEEHSSYKADNGPSSAELRRIFKLVSTGVPLAVIALQKALREFPDHPDLLIQEAILFIKKGKYKKAGRTLQGILEVHPERTDALFLLGEIAQFYEKDPERAMDHYRKVLAIDPGFPEANFRMGLLLQEQDQFKKAAAAFRKVFKAQSEHIPARYYYGSLLAYQLQKVKKGIKQLKKVAASDPQHPFAFYDLAYLYHSRGELGRARKYYLQAIRNNPELKTPENDAAFAIDEAGENGPIRNQPSIDVGRSFVGETKTKMDDAMHTDNIPKLVLITGATSGIGRATAFRLAEAGFRLILTGRRQDQLQSVCDQIKEMYPVQVMGLVFDVRDYSAVESRLEGLPDEWKRIEVLINNAGLAKGLAPIQEGELRHWEQMIDTNVKGLLYVTRLVTPGMVERGTGQVINVCSTAGKEAYPNGNVYCATKHAVDALTKAMRIDLHKHHIRVGQVSPGHVEETEFALVRFDGDAKKARIYEDFNPLTSRDVADAIHYMITRPPHVNIQEILMMGTQQANSLFIHRSGRSEELEDQPET